MWYHLKARFDKIKLWVLHPGISERPGYTVDILRGLPEGSRLARLYLEYLSLILYTNSRAKFPAVIYSGHHPPNPHTLGSTTQIWIGGLLYVDDLALMWTCPLELQAILHVCQQWSIQNRIQIDTDKTKIMAFFETPSLLRARGAQHQPGPNMPPFHVFSLAGLGSLLIPYPRSLSIWVPWSYFGPQTHYVPRYCRSHKTWFPRPSPCPGGFLLAPIWQELFSAYPDAKARPLEINSTTPLPPELAVHPKRNRHQNNAN